MGKRVNKHSLFKAFLRIKNLPKNFVRWFGWLGNNKKGEVLKGLGFEQKEIKELAREAGWEKVGLYEVKSFGKETWLFEKVNEKVPISRLNFSDTAGLDVVRRQAEAG